MFLFFRNLLWPLFRTLGPCNGVGVMQEEEGHLEDVCFGGLRRAVALLKLPEGAGSEFLQKRRPPDVDQLWPLRRQDQWRESHNGQN